MKRDKELKLAKYDQSGKARMVAEVAKGIGWEKLWDAALTTEVAGGEGASYVCHQCFGDGSNCSCEHQKVPEDLLNSLFSF